MPPSRPCRYCVAGLPESYEVDCAGRCVVCLDTRIAEVTECDGCDDTGHALKRYLVTHHDGGESDCYYCDDCADLARMDYNGETKSIARLEVGHV